MSKNLLKLLTELRDEYLHKKKCLIGNLDQNIPDDKKDKIRLKIYTLIEKINQVEKEMNEEVLRGAKGE